ncbi:hypothetical protein LSTR_LSTR010367 [Laodelphax striatellus]|uniref:Angiotensin-converting enzyme n=1 Tax=Laodelphax striatellus TaxID=195883 RepID=A0A482WJX8_LAOST|nr:hypothetical protein LSTR_LSTR010367 [Laodelphax striatellus]
MALSALGIQYFLLILTLVKGDHDIFDGIDTDLNYFNRLQANLTWQALTGSGKFDLEMMAQIGEAQIKWKNEKCSMLNEMLEEKNNSIDQEDRRKFFIFCRGPTYTAAQARDMSVLLKELQSLYVDSRLCRGPHLPCYSAEPDLERLFAGSRDQAELLWAWHAWRDRVAPARPLYRQLVAVQNVAARNQGYHDIGECWREELEMPHLPQIVEQLYDDVRPLFNMLHAYVRHRLSLVYGRDVVSPTKPIPAHLLGNLWAQNWDNIMDVVAPYLASKFDLDRVMRDDRKWSVLDMARRAEDFYASMGLPLMADKFWSHSVLENSNGRQCHGTAANMFDNDDYRILMCAEPSMEDFYVLHHELGHIQYYMAYKNQPAIFQDAANSAFHESIGDAVMYGVMTPGHLERLGLITSAEDPDLDIYLLLRSALNKLPQLGFGLALEQWRWITQSSKKAEGYWNGLWWQLRQLHQGIQPPSLRSDPLYFDPAAKFHIIDNTPYIRYVVGGFLQMQRFEALCENSKQKACDDPLPLHRCDIYNSTAAGDRLRKMMSLGSSRHWSDALNYLTNGKNNKISSAAILNYYKPLAVWLKQQIEKLSIPVGW